MPDIRFSYLTGKEKHLIFDVFAYIMIV